MKKKKNFFVVFNVVRAELYARFNKININKLEKWLVELLLEKEGTGAVPDEFLLDSAARELLFFLKGGGNVLVKVERRKFDRKMDVTISSFGSKFFLTIKMNYLSEPLRIEWRKEGGGVALSREEVDKYQEFIKNDGRYSQYREYCENFPMIIDCDDHGEEWCCGQCEGCQFREWHLKENEKIFPENWAFEA